MDGTVIYRRHGKLSGNVSEIIRDPLRANYKTYQSIDRAWVAEEEDFTDKQGKRVNTRN